MNSLKEISKVIKKAENIAIFTHISPDFDAFGSAFTLAKSLRQIGKNVEIFSKEPLTSRLRLIFKDDVNHGKCNEKLFDLFICVDVSTNNRLGDYSHIFENSNNAHIILDHHYSSNLNCKYSYIEPEMSSCCEIIFKLLEIMKVKIDKEIASYLYAGLSSDTSSFLNSNTKINSLLTAAKLMEYGADIHTINQYLYETRSKKEIEFKRYLWNNYKIYKDCAYCLVDLKSLKELKGNKADCDTFSKSLVSIEGINRSFSLVEIENGLFSLSMRSKVGFDVRVVAEKVGGGGHICAAGARFNAKNIETAKKMILNAIFQGEENE